MYNKDYERVLELIKNAAEFSKDYDNTLRCKKNVDQFQRTEAWKCLQDMIQEYWSQIEFFGCLFDGITINRNIDPSSLSDDSIKAQLAYISRHIPAYVLLRKGDEEMAKKLSEWINKQVNI